MIMPLVISLAAFMTSCGVGLGPVAGLAKSRMYCVACASVGGFDTPPGSTLMRLIMIALAAKPFRSISGWKPPFSQPTWPRSQPFFLFCTGAPSRIAVTAPSCDRRSPLWANGSGRPRCRISLAAFL